MADPSNVLHIPLVDHHNEVKVLRDIEVPAKFFKRMRLGVPVLDEIFGGKEWPGVMPGTSVLFTGMPGAGKSTAALQLADLFQGNEDRKVLYNCGEENEFMVKMRADRLGIAGNFGFSCIEDPDVLVETCRKTGVEILFQDSIQSLQLPGDAVGRDTRLKAIGKRIHKFAKEDDVSVFLVGHITKSGEFAGPMELKHDLDIHAHIRLNPDTLGRELVLTKNRFGPAGIPYEVSLTDRGLDFNAMAATPEAPGIGGKTGERREATHRVIKEALLKGERISRACHGRLGIDCSDGFWAARVEEVLFDLRANGTVVGKELRGGKAFQFVEA